MSDEHPYRVGDLWRDKNDALWFVVACGPGGGLRMRCGTDDSHAHPDFVKATYGPLTRVYPDGSGEEARES